MKGYKEKWIRNIWFWFEIYENWKNKQKKNQKDFLIKGKLQEDIR